MRPQPSRPQIRNREEFEETRTASRRKQVRSWLILGAGAVGVASAVAKWAMQSRQAASTSAKNRILRDSVSDVALSQMEGTGTPVPLQGMPASATPTNDARTFLVEPETASGLPQSQVAMETSPTASTPKKSKTSKPAKMVPASYTEMTVTPVASRKRGKMSEEYDQALQANALPTDEREGERSNQRMVAKSMTSRNSFTPVNAMQGAQPGTVVPAPLSSTDSPAEQALSTQAESKMSVGEELRDREFPVPPQESGAFSQKLVVDQETMTDNGPREGGVIGTVEGDRQNKGVVVDILDQSADTPDFAQQR